MLRAYSEHNNTDVLRTYGALKGDNQFNRNAIKLKHIDVMETCLNHTLYWVDDIMFNFYLREPHLLLVRMCLKQFLSYVKLKVNGVFPQIGAMYRK